MADESQLKQTFIGTADFLALQSSAGRKSDRNENFLSEETSFGNFLLAPHMSPLRIKMPPEAAEKSCCGVPAHEMPESEFEDIE